MKLLPTACVYITNNSKIKVIYEWSGWEMKKLILAMLMIGLLAACNQNETTAQEAYDIMVTAHEEGREMTEAEEEKVYAYTRKAKNPQQVTDVERAVGAMEFNFYQPENFKQAKQYADEVFANQKDS